MPRRKARRAPGGKLLRWLRRLAVVGLLREMVKWESEIVQQEK